MHQNENTLLKYDWKKIVYFYLWVNYLFYADFMKGGTNSNWIDNGYSFFTFVLNKIILFYVSNGIKNIYLLVVELKAIITAWSKILKINFFFVIHLIRECSNYNKTTHKKVINLIK